jgi:hypothetical protein
MTCNKQPLEKMFYQKHKCAGGFHDLEILKLMWKTENVIDDHTPAEQMKMLKGFKS